LYLLVINPYLVVANSRVSPHFCCEGFLFLIVTLQLSILTPFAARGFRV